VFKVPYLIVYFWSIESHVDSVCGGVMVWFQRWLLIWSVAHHKVHNRSRRLEHIIEHLVTSDISNLIRATFSASETVLKLQNCCGHGVNNFCLTLSGSELSLMIPHVDITLE
jgi:hypothetical protein